MRHDWENLADGVWRTRLPFLDVTVGVISGRDGALLVDADTSVGRAHAIGRDVEELTGGHVNRIVLTHNHFDHVLGSAGFRDAEVYCAPQVGATIADEMGGGTRLRDEALRHGADPDELDDTIAALSVPAHQVHDAVVDLGDRAVTVTHLGRGHTDHDLVAVVPGERTVVFCGDLVEESGDPALDADSDLAAWPDTLAALVCAFGDDAVYVPGHGAVVDANFVRRQRQWLIDRAAGAE
ncbi:MBL fold metallo-hydrolase [Mycolicibacterium smegmatis]|uniref:Metallo-beta-lactamase superfamily protein n=1 Tax=Mycolicibacterium smegmatis (strain MKD8) TaxID=1214915 RepID=A0A2U9PQY0_MYCSE|nr:MBL fold metallo-hydrolase [Mycolicibacterium smegmatis]AWT54202.1 Metallo-beta-lactamase superfamily protein [Mycolicibacterium smegmatis MKD8]